MYTEYQNKLHVHTLTLEYFAYFQNKSVFSVFLSVRLFSVLRGHSFFSSTPQRPMTSDFEGFSVSINCRYQNVRKTLTYL